MSDFEIPRRVSATSEIREKRLPSARPRFFPIQRALPSSNMALHRIGKKKTKKKKKKKDLVK